MVVMYKRKLIEIEDIVEPDGLIVKNGISDAITVKGTGIYKRGTILMSDSDGNFTQVTEAGIKTSEELCILLEDLEFEEDTIALTIGEFDGVFSRKHLILPDGMEFEDDVIRALRIKGIYVR